MQYRQTTLKSIGTRKIKNVCVEKYINILSGRNTIRYLQLFKKEAYMIIILLFDNNLNITILIRSYVNFAMSSVSWSVTVNGRSH